MSNFEIKTHKVGRTYNAPHFFILNKGLNSGKPLEKPCPNCFIITTPTEETKKTLFYICLSLHIGAYFAYYLKGSVIPFITKTDCLKVLNKAYFKDLKDANSLQKYLQTVSKIQEKEKLIKQQLKVINKLKVAFIQNYLSS